MMRYLTILLLFCCVATFTYAEDAAVTATPAGTSDVPEVDVPEVVVPEVVPEVVVPELTPEEIKAEADKKKLQSVLDSLESTQLALSEKLKEQTALQSRYKSAGPTEKEAFQAELDKVALDIKNLRTSFEQVAIGGIRLEAYGLTETPFDWKEELVLITQPVIESLKSLTEKPRNLERLRTIIADRRLRLEEIGKAITILESRLAAKPPTLIVPLLSKTLDDWQSKKKDNLREMELAQVQLDSLLGNNTAWYETIVTSVKSFFNGRGKTLLIAVIVSVVIWQVMRGLLWLIRKKAQSGKSTRRRIFAYLYKFLTTLLIVIGIMVVLYIRGDLLLLALMIIIFVGFVLAVRSYLPGYITEAKTLLDLGTVREEELVVYNGIPWEVHHINVQSILINPDIHGILRIPLSELVNLKSRPAGRGENWFPCRKGDLLILPSGSTGEVMRQTPDSVEFMCKGGMRLSYPTAAVFEMGLLNLTKGDSYAALTVFGIDYSHLDICLTMVPDKFAEAVKEGLTQAGLGEHIVDVSVDFKVANSSSLDYQIIATMHSRAASSYFKVERVLQQSCVRACAENDWGIPFPQLTVHSAETGE
ncbi:hypothetical protein [Leucothrix arctica]|uniref:Mechanosensitive ion channel protein MscS n=1 Tax=Leucothrix arctica TaxID=1481894 RepID=A0A317CID3_9GAMM|nr:hypothetical protein [Leucothrix arctica]PWQ97931.1 hypothetical protein DKT75_05555 [Leucothrix arctica]